MLHGLELTYRAKGLSQLGVSDIILGSTLWSRTGQHFFRKKGNFSFKVFFDQFKTL
jgi:hypothetical protein